MDIQLAWNTYLCLASPKSAHVSLASAEGQLSIKGFWEFWGSSESHGRCGSDFRLLMSFWFTLSLTPRTLSSIFRHTRWGMLLSFLDFPENLSHEAFMQVTEFIKVWVDEGAYVIAIQTIKSWLLNTPAFKNSRSHYYLGLCKPFSCHPLFFLPAAIPFFLLCPVPNSCLFLMKGNLATYVLSSSPFHQSFSFFPTTGISEYFP